MALGINIGKLDTALDRAVEAAVDPSLWGDVLDRVAEATGAFGVNIVPIAGSFPGGLIMTDSLQPALEGYFDGGWNKNEWRRRGLPLLSRQGTVLEQHYTTRDEFTDEEYYRAQSKYGLGRTCIVGLSSPSDLVCFTLHRRLDEDPFDVEDETVFRAMRDRLMVSAQIMWNAGAHRIEGMLEAFQMARIGAVFFDRFGKVRSTNAAAERMLGNELQISGGELRSKVHAETVRIRQRMKAILTESWLDPRLAEPIQIHREAARPILLRIQRLGGNFPDVFSPSVGVCLMETLDPPKASESTSIAGALGLTQTQAALAGMLADGISLRDAAEMRGISYETARTHLRAIFAKVGVGRQSELVALVVRMRTIAS